MGQPASIVFMCSGAILLVLLAVGCHKQDQELPASSSKPAPHLKKHAFADDLREEEPLPDNPQFLIQPPRGYKRNLVQDTTSSNAKTMVKWVGPPRKDGSEHQILVIIGKERPGGRKFTDYEPFVNSYLSARKSRLGRIQRQPSEEITIHGIVFRKVHWRAGNGNLRPKTFGILLYATVGATDVILDSEDGEAHYRDTLGLAEAVALSFRSTGKKR
jgi:hypothetical protein